MSGSSEIRPPTLLALPSYLAGHVARIARRGLEEALAENGLRLPHFAVLTALAELGALPQHELADRLGLNRSHLVGYLDDVEGRGLVSRGRDAADRRRQVVAPTRAGKELTDRLAEVARRSERELLGALNDDEHDLLVDLLRRIVTTDDERRLRTIPAHSRRS
jgi:DNA-binding MarR family transcriptional regulator